MKYRPSYPQGVLGWLVERGLGRGSIVADIGSGTGIFSGILLDSGHTVLGVEPNAEMRAKADELLRDRDGFVSVNGTAEETTLDSESVDLVTSAQAFHWFDPGAAKKEFRRILRPEGKVALVWNDRHADGSTFMTDYEALLEAWGTDYRNTTYRFRPLKKTFDAFFSGAYETATFANAQQLDEDGLVGRFFSSSYTPAKSDPRYADAEDAARSVFDKYQIGHQVELVYVTRIYYGLP